MQCLVAAAEHDSVTAAAAALGITQPALSHQLASLERELDVELLERQRRGSRLTAAGRALVPHARSAVDAERAFAARARRVAELETGELRICCAQSVTTGLLPPVLRRWSRRRPDVTITLQEFDSADRVAATLLAGEADLGIGPRPGAWDGESTVLGWEEIVVALAADAPLAVRKTITVAALAQQPIVSFIAGHALAAWVDAFFGGAAPRVSVRTGQTGAAATLAATGIGAALVPLSALPPHYRGVVRRLSPKQGRDVVALTTGRQDALVSAFVADLVARGVPRLPQ